MAMVVLPVGAAAYTTPPTYSKVPFAIVQSGFELVGKILTAVGPSIGAIPAWLNEDLMNTIGGWAGGPLSWTVDMLAWGLDLGATIWASVGPVLGIEEADMPLGAILSGLACGLLTCWSATNCTGTFAPC